MCDLKVDFFVERRHIHTLNFKSGDPVPETSVALSRRLQQSDATDSNFLWPQEIMFYSNIEATRVSRFMVELSNFAAKLCPHPRMKSHNFED